MAALGNSVALMCRLCAQRSSQVACSCTSMATCALTTQSTGETCCLVKEPRLSQTDRDYALVSLVMCSCLLMLLSLTINCCYISVSVHTSSIWLYITEWFHDVVSLRCRYSDSGGGTTATTVKQLTNVD